jgi:16S rRNA (adenine1518-N6/adenine1519-N6)-dimethyltransferase
MRERLQVFAAATCERMPVCRRQARRSKVRDNLPPLREVIANYDLAAKKSLGQNFLLDLNLTAKIARAAGATEGGVFYEVGPGPGGLTRALLGEGAEKVIAVERDRRCLPALADIAANYPGKLEVINADALALDERTILPSGVRVAANLPYNIGTALLIKWLTGASASPDVRPGENSWPPFWSSLTLMFQREVAERIVAKPGGEQYGRLSVLAAWRTRARILFDVNRNAFVPPPSVTSSIVRLEPLPEPVAPADLKKLETVTAAAFGQRRKMLRQSLKPLGGEALLERAGIDPTTRPEQLSVVQFAALANALGR